MFLPLRVIKIITLTSLGHFDFPTQLSLRGPFIFRMLRNRYAEQFVTDIKVHQGVEIGSVPAALPVWKKNFLIQAVILDNYSRESRAVYHTYQK